MTPNELADKRGPLELIPLWLWVLLFALMFAWFVWRTLRPEDGPTPFTEDELARVGEEAVERRTTSLSVPPLPDVSIVSIQAEREKRDNKAICDRVLGRK